MDILAVRTSIASRPLHWWTRAVTSGDKVPSTIDSTCSCRPALQACPKRCRVSGCRMICWLHAALPKTPARSWGARYLRKWHQDWCGRWTYCPKRDGGKAYRPSRPLGSPGCAGDTLLPATQVQSRPRRTPFWLGRGAHRISSEFKLPLIACPKLDHTGTTVLQR